jgi:hypothetical protein
MGKRFFFDLRRRRRRRRRGKGFRETICKHWTFF